MGKGRRKREIERGGDKIGGKRGQEGKIKWKEV